MTIKLGFVTRSRSERRHRNFFVSIAFSSIFMTAGCSGGGEPSTGPSEADKAQAEAPTGDRAVPGVAVESVETSATDADKSDVAADGIPECRYLDDASAAAILPDSGEPERDGSKDHYCGWRFSDGLSVRIDVFDLEKTLAEEAVSPPLAPQSPEPGPGENAALTMGLFAQSEPQGFKFDYPPRRVQITAVGRGATPDEEGLRRAAYTVAERLEKISD